MKIDKKSIKSWLYLVYGSLLIVVMLPFRLFEKFSKKNPKVVLYGHKLNGNLLPLYRHWSSLDDVDCYFISFDQDYINSEKAQNVNMLNAFSVKDAYKIAAASVFVSDHGLHHFVILRLLTSMRFVHVLHGIPFKGYDSEDFRHLHGHDQIWVSSESMKKMHMERFGFREDQVKVTGFARIEDISKYEKDSAAIKRKYDLSPNKKTILVAPTWKQDSKDRSAVPFGLSVDDFINLVMKSAGEGVQLIFRSHLNESGVEGPTGRNPNVHIMPYSAYPVAEEFVAISDILITDWSSIAFDFLSTGRPIIYLDVEPPFRKGFSLGPENRVGAVAGSGADLMEAVRRVVDSLATEEPISARAKAVKETVFGDTLDGRMLDRCDECLLSLISKKRGSL